jgi:hypothetical protein
MTEENKNEDALSSYLFEELVFFVDTNNYTIHPLTKKEEMFISEFMPAFVGAKIDAYIFELMHIVKLYKLPYVVKTIQGCNKLSLDVVKTTLCSKESYEEYLRKLKEERDKKK